MKHKKPKPNVTDKTYRIASYGSLKRGFKLNHLLNGQKFLGESSVKGKMFLSSSGWFPYLFKDGTDTHIVEVYGISESTFLYIKHMEESSGYVTEQIRLPKYKEVSIFFADPSIRRLIEKNNPSIDAFTHEIINKIKQVYET